MAEIVEFAALEPSAQELIKTSLVARERAYSPYSKFKVGSALLSKDGTVYMGCNVENVSYGLSICAERTALVSAVASGSREFISIAVSAELGDTFVPPCGACRQFLAEFGPDITVYLTRPNMNSIMKTTSGHLLPLNTNLGNLKNSLTTNNK